MTTILLAIAAVLGVTVPDVPSVDEACNGGLMDCAEPDAPSAQNGCNGGWAADECDAD